MNQKTDVTKEHEQRSTKTIKGTVNEIINVLKGTPFKDGNARFTMKLFNHIYLINNVGDIVVFWFKSI